MKATPQHVTRATLDEVVRMSALAHQASGHVWKSTGASDPKLGISYDPTSEAFQTALRTTILPEEQFRRFLEGLTQIQRDELRALTWLARNDAQFRGLPEQEAYDAAMAHARDTRDKRDVDYLMGLPLHDYLPRTW